MYHLQENSDPERSDSINILSASKDEPLDSFVVRLLDVANDTSSHVRGIFDGITLDVDHISKKKAVIQMFVKKKQKHIERATAALIEMPDERTYENILLLLWKAKTVEDVVFLIEDKRLISKKNYQGGLINRDDRLEYARWIVEGALESIQKQWLVKNDKPISECIRSFIKDWEERYLDHEHKKKKRKK